MYEEENEFGYFQNNNDDSDKEKYGNTGNDTIFVDNLMWEDIDNDIFIPGIPYHYCGANGLEKGVEKLFQTILECVMLTRGIFLQ